MLIPAEKEIIARKWCSIENGVELVSDDIMLPSDDGQYFSPFQFDIASSRNEKELEKTVFEKNLAKLDKLIESSNIIGIDPSKPDCRKVLGMVKSGKHDSGGGTYHSILGDCFLLSKADADKKYMILTDKNMYDYFFKRCNGILDGIILKYLDVDKYKNLLP